MSRSTAHGTSENEDPIDEGPVLDIDTVRLSTRPLSECDETLFCELLGDPDTMRFVGPPMRRERAARSFRTALALTRRHPVEQLYLAIVEKCTLQPVGICSLLQINPRRRSAEAGLILKPAAQARGFGKEVMTALLTRAFSMFPIDEVRCRTFAAHSVVERLNVSIGLMRSSKDFGSCDQGPATTIWYAFRNAWFTK